ncbi:MAG TPA: glutathione S-transferase family protein [Stellaceae bacterium]|nr:glutathione S-transferase family protein [Stellaceae bacterium]
MADIVLYGIPMSTYVRSARMACVEKGVPYTLEPVMPHSEPINALHPFGKIPAMRHSDFTLYETSAIMRYIDDAFEGPRLTPSNTRGRARMEQWISTFNAYFDSALIRRIVVQYAFPSGPDGKPDRAIIDKAAEDAKKQMALLDEALDEGPFILGANISLADLLLAPMMAYFVRTPEGKAITAASKNLQRSGAAMRARKSYLETVPPPPPKRD